MYLFLRIPYTLEKKKKSVAAFYYNSAKEKY